VFNRGESDSVGGGRFDLVNDTELGGNSTSDFDEPRSYFVFITSVVEHCK
jgi:hypothetical protein